MKTLSKTELILSSTSHVFKIFTYICVVIVILNLAYRLDVYIQECTKYKSEQIEESKLMQDQIIQYLNEVGYNFNRK